MKSKAMALLPIMLIALSVVGFAYANWAKIVTINGTVTTGTFDLKPSCTIVVLSPTDKPWVPDVGQTIVGNTVTYWIKNAFPCLRVKIMFDIHNSGTIPAGLKSLKFDGVLVPLVPDMGPAIEKYLEDKVPGLEVESITWTGVPFGQIDPCKTADVEIVIHFTEDTKQTQSYTFLIEFEYWNWNEV